MKARELSVLSYLPVLFSVFVLAACGGVKIAPTPSLPKALVTKIEARVGVVIPADQSDFEHSETRGGVPWTITLGPGPASTPAPYMPPDFAKCSSSRTSTRRVPPPGSRAFSSRASSSIHSRPRARPAVSMSP